MANKTCRESRAKKRAKKAEKTIKPNQQNWFEIDLISRIGQPWSKFEAKIVLNKLWTTLDFLWLGISILIHQVAILLVLLHYFPPYLAAFIKIPWKKTICLAIAKQSESLNEFLISSTMLTSNLPSMRHKMQTPKAN